MANQNRPASGTLFFVLTVLVLFVAITATLMLANGYRNLNLLLTHFGYQPIRAQGPAPVLRPYETKGNRLPRMKVIVNKRLLLPENGMETSFIRSIDKDPQAMCERLKQGGFVNAGWTTSGFNNSNWECISYTEYPSEKEGVTSASSLFLSIKGGDESRISSFRVKLNIESPNARTRVTDAAIRAVGIFMNAVRWEGGPDMFAKIRNLQEFDETAFGTRIQMKREFGDIPRFNFLITPDKSKKRKPWQKDYFDRRQWLPLPDEVSDSSRVH